MSMSMDTTLYIHIITYSVVVALLVVVPAVVGATEVEGIDESLTACAFSCAQATIH